MNEKQEHIQLKKKIESFQHDLDEFTMKKSAVFEKTLQDIKDDLEYMLLEYQKKCNDRNERLPEWNKKVRERNKVGPKEALIDFVSKNAKDFIDNMEKKGMRFDEDANMVVKKLKTRNDRVTGLIPEESKYKPKPLLTSDNFFQRFKGKLDAAAKDIMIRLTTALQEKKDKARDIFQDYHDPVELLKMLEKPYKIKSYSFFADTEEKIKTSDGPIKPIVPHTSKVPLTFKKFGHIMKYIEELQPALQTRFFIHAERGVCIYILQKNISIFVSDETQNDKFTHATYFIRGPILEEETLTKEKLSEYQGKRIMYNESRPKRIEGLFVENPENWPILSEEKEDTTETHKTLITDKTAFISIIKKNFTPETLTTPSYRKFAQEYNAIQGNTILLNDTIYGNSSLLGLGGKRTLEDIRNVIFESKKPKLEIPQSSYFFNEHTTQTLLSIKGCEGFDPNTSLGASNYDNWTLELLRRGYNEQYVDAIKNKSREEKKRKLQEYTGIKGIPLFALKITSMLGGRVRSVDACYQKMLRKRFVLYMGDGQRESDDFKQLNTQILEYETKWEDQVLHPNTKKIEKKGEVVELLADNPLKNKEIPEVISGKVVESGKYLIRDKSPISVINPSTVENELTISSIITSELAESIKGPLTLQNFPLYRVKNVKIISETRAYRIVKAQNCEVELRLYKSNVGETKRLYPGETIDVFGVRKNFQDNFILAHREKEKGLHKMIQFRNTHDDVLIEGFIPGKKYEAVVNNIQKNYVYLSLTKSYSGRIPLKSGASHKVGDVVKVVFDKVDKDFQHKKIVQIH